MFLWFSLCCLFIVVLCVVCVCARARVLLCARVCARVCVRVCVLVYACVLVCVRALLPPGDYPVAFNKYISVPGIRAPFHVPGRSH